MWRNTIKKDYGPRRESRYDFAIYYIVYTIVFPFFFVNVFIAFVILTFQGEGDAQLELECSLGMFSVWRRAFKLVLTRWRSKSIRSRFRDHQPITCRLKASVLKITSENWNLFERKKWSNLLGICNQFQTDKQIYAKR